MRCYNAAMSKMKNGAPNRFWRIVGIFGAVILSGFILIVDPARAVIEIGVIAVGGFIRAVSRPR
jgi:hypothetical protein